MSQLRNLLVLSGLLVLAACSSPQEPESTVAAEEPATGTAITNVTVIDAANGVRENQTVVFDGDEIVTVQAADAEVDVAESIDGAGKFLIPGLWDMHVHLTYQDEFTEDMPALFLAHGVTSVRDTGGLIHKIKPVVESMRAEGAIAPRVYFSGPLLDGEYVVYDGESRPEIGAQNASVDAARENIQALKDEGVDFVKIYEMVSPEVFEALAGAAQENGLPIAAHVPLSMLASNAGPQVDSMEHLRNVELDCASNSAELYEERLGMLAGHDGGPGFELRSSMHAAQRSEAIANYDEERCQRTIDSLRSTIQVPTIRLNTMAIYPPYARDDWDDVLAMLPEGAVEAWQQATAQWNETNTSEPAEGDYATFGRWSLDMVQRMHSAGVPIGAGTDTPIGFALPGDSLHTELERLVDAGLTPMDAIEAATVRPAEFLSLDAEMGSVEPGMRADLVLLNANPLDDIANTRSIDRVVSAGRVLLPEQLLSNR